MPSLPDPHRRTLTRRRWSALEDSDLRAVVGQLGRFAFRGGVVDVWAEFNAWRSPFLQRSLEAVRKRCAKLGLAVPRRRLLDDWEASLWEGFVRAIAFQAVELGMAVPRMPTGGGAALGCDRPDSVAGAFSAWPDVCLGEEPS